MAKVTAPLLSFGASGQIGKTQVYGSWRGVQYARRHVVPANPRTSAQTQTRGTFTWLTQVYKLMSATAQAAWVAYAKGKPLTGPNAFSKFNLSILRGTTGAPPSDLAGMVASPGNGGGLAPAALTPTDATGHVISAAMTAPTLPAGWSITNAVAVAAKEVDASTSIDYATFEAADNTTPYAPQISTGAAGTYRVMAFFVFLKPDGTTVYGPSIDASVVIA